MAEKKKEKLDQILAKLDGHDKKFKQMATKDDLKGLATKDDLKGMATKDDLARLRGEVMGGMDKVMGELEKAREDRVFARAKDQEQDRRLEGLERWKQKIEVKIGS